MTTSTKPVVIERIFFGARDAMIAEVSAFAEVEGKYLLLSEGNAQFETAGFETLKDAREEARAILRTLPEARGAKICRVY